MTILEQNYRKLGELVPKVQWAGREWLEECDRLGLRFKILEAYRTQERQNSLYAQGRTKPGAIVTYTLRSMHTRRLAVDVLPLNCTYQDLEEVAKKYGITHPFASGKFRDLPHFEFVKVGPKPLVLSPEARLRQLKARIERLKEPARTRASRRLQSRLQSSP